MNSPGTPETPCADSQLNDAGYRQRCLDALSVSDTGAFRRGLRALRRL